MATESRVQIEKLDTNNYGIGDRATQALLLSQGSFMGFKQMLHTQLG